MLDVFISTRFKNNLRCQMLNFPTYKCCRQRGTIFENFDSDNLKLFNIKVINRVNFLFLSVSQIVIVAILV
jgi:hypothetical protein